MPIEFGDFDNDDALDTAEPDPEQVARKIHRLRVLRNREMVDWDSLSDEDRATLIDIVAHLLAWLKRQGAIR
jgi:hypothetical protein